MCRGQWWCWPAHCAGWEAVQLRCLREIRIRALHFFFPHNFLWPVFEMLRSYCEIYRLKNLEHFADFQIAVDGFLQPTRKESESLFYFRNTINFPFMHFPIHWSIHSHGYLANIQGTVLLLGVWHLWYCWHMLGRCDGGNLEVAIAAVRRWPKSLLLGL